MKEIIVEKFGTETVANKNGADWTRIDDYAKDISSAMDRYDFVVVSSGATAIGKSICKKRFGDKPLPSLQLQATMGSASLNKIWEERFASYGVTATQILATPHEIDDPKEKPELQRVISESHKYGGIVPVFNGNDAMTRELVDDLDKFADNDGFSEHISALVGASKLIIYTQKGGFFDENWSEVSCLEPKDYEWAIGVTQDRAKDAYESSSEKISRGGMPKKLAAVIRAAQAGTDSYIARAGTPLDVVLAGESGTIVPAITSACMSEALTVVAKDQ